MDFSQFLPRDTHRPLAWLGKHTDWLRTTVDAENRIVFKWNFPSKDDKISAEDYAFINIIKETCDGQYVGTSDRMLSLFYRAAAASLSLGPKMFQPTPIQCEAMENVDVDVPFSDYRQPFETLIIQIPDGYRRDAMARMKLSEFPNYALVHHDLSSNIITVASNYNKRERAETVVAVLRPTPNTETIEAEFRKEELKNEPAVDRLIQRLAVNMCLLLTQYRTRLRPLDKDAMERLSKLAKKKDPERADRARLMKAGQFMVVEFEQQIQLHDVEEDAPGEVTEYIPGRSGYTVTPHWRKGHWRRQQHGAAWRLRATPDDLITVIDETHHRKFIKPIMVKKSMFGGDKSQTKVLYKGGSDDDIKRDIRPHEEPPEEKVEEKPEIKDEKPEEKPKPDEYGA